MTNYDSQIRAFIKQYPKYAEAKNLDINLYCDIMQNGNIIAESNLPHDIEKVESRMATSWTICDKEGE